MGLLMVRSFVTNSVLISYSSCLVLLVRSVMTKRVLILYSHFLPACMYAAPACTSCTAVMRTKADVPLLVRNFEDGCGTPAVSSDSPQCNPLYGFAICHDTLTHPPLVPFHPDSFTKWVFE